mmetsp:Transcript_40886/g.128767  ORF Transcript_40886/g.128767 Transcript_40886/m.128767 type:complete len:95 (-) Transcript_40886:34-318(-)
MRWAIVGGGGSGERGCHDGLPEMFRARQRIRISCAFVFMWMSRRNTPGLQAVLALTCIGDCPGRGRISIKQAGGGRRVEGGGRELVDHGKMIMR